MPFFSTGGRPGNGEMHRLLTQFFSQGSLRELLERRHFCHKTFRDSGKKGLLRGPRLRKMVALLFGIELRQIAPEMRLSCFSTIEIHERLWVKRRKELRQTTMNHFIAVTDELLSHIVALLPIFGSESAGRDKNRTSSLEVWTIDDSLPRYGLPFPNGTNDEEAAQ